jgi:hypothetical protein
MVKSIRGVSAVALALVAATSIGGCKPDFGTRASQVTALTVLAIRSTPAEVTPGNPVHYDALVAQPGGSVGNAQIDWAYCTQPKSVSEVNDVSLSCFARSAAWIDELSVGPSANGTVPTDACRNFGSDVPASMPGQPPGRPADPDTTGGYFQPVRALLASSDPVGILALGQTRIRCSLVGATPQVSTDFNKGYRPNENPSFSPDQVTLAATGAAVTDESAMGDPTPVAAGSAVTFAVGWPACPITAVCGDGICSPGEDTTSCIADCSKPKGCGGSETYAYFDPVGLALVTRHEALRVAWYADAGSFVDDATGHREDEYAAALAASPPTAGPTTTSNTWTAPTSAGVVHLWAVLSDSRGGVSWKSFVVKVQ